MKRRDWGFLLLYLLLGAAIFLTRYFELPLALTGIISALAVVSIPVAERIENLLDERRQHRQKETKVNKLASEFIARASELGLKTIRSEQLKQEILDTNTKLATFDVFKVGVQHSFDDLREFQKDILLILILCRQVEAVNDSITRAQLRSHIGELLSRFDLSSPDQSTLELLGAYESVRDAIRTGDPDSATSPFSNSSGNPQDTALDLAKNYGTNEQLAIILFNDRERSEELRRTLGRLVARGKLSSQNVSREAAQRIKQDMEWRGGSSTKYILFSQKMHYSEPVENKIESFPFFRVGTRETGSGFPEEMEYMRMYLIYPELDYGSPQNFLEREIIPVLPEEYDDDSFIAAMPLELADLEIYPDTDDLEGYISGKFAALNFLKTGSSEDLSEIITERLTSEIDISELLATIPFNVLVPDIDPEEKEVIIDNYDTLKEEFGISELFDWGEVDSQRLGERLDELDTDDYSDRWSELAGDIVSRASRYSEATFREAV
jgi:hypothetical protein